MMKRILSFLLAFLIVLSNIPVVTFAEEEVPTDPNACPVCSVVACGQEHHFCETCQSYICTTDHDAKDLCKDCGNEVCTCAFQEPAPSEDPVAPVNKDDDGCSCPEGHDVTSGHVATCALYICPECGTGPYHTECPKSEEPTEAPTEKPDNCPYCEDTLGEDGAVVHAVGCNADYAYNGSGDVGKYVRLIKEAAQEYDVFASATPESADYGWWYPYADFAEGTVMRITGWYWDMETTALWYKVELHQGAFPAEDWPDPAWILQRYTDTSYENFPEILKFVTACSVCGEFECGKEHVKCGECGEYDCEKDHTPTEEPTEPPTDPENTCECCENCTGAEGCECQCGGCAFCEKKINGIFATITDSNGNEQTVAVTGDNVPKDAKLIVTQPTYEATLQRFVGKDIESLWSITVYDENGNEWQPDSPVLVTLTTSDDNAKYAAVYHFLDTAAAVKRAVNGNSMGYAYYADFDYIDDSTRSILSKEIAAYQAGTGRDNPGMALSLQINLEVVDNSFSFLTDSFSLFSAHTYTAKETKYGLDIDNRIELQDKNDSEWYATAGQDIYLDCQWPIPSTKNFDVTGPADDAVAPSKWYPGRVRVHIHNDAAEGSEIVISYSTATGTTHKINVLVVKEYTIKYNANGGTVNGASSYTQNLITDDTGYSGLLTPTRTGYDFQGWYTAAEGGSKVEKWSGRENLTLYAHWKLKSYTVSYNTNGGTGSIGNQTKNYGSNLTLSNGSGFSRTGHTLTGWNTKADGTGTAYALSGTYTSNAAATLYAVWSTNIYKVTLDKNGGTGGTDGPYYYKYKTTGSNGQSDTDGKIYYYTDAACTQTVLNGSGEDRYYHINIPSKVGYTFAGYKHSNGTIYIDANGTCVNNIYDNIPEDSTLVAQWTPNTDAWYTVCYKWTETVGGETKEGQVYDSNGKALDNKHVSKLAYGTKHTETAPTLTGYTPIGNATVEMTAGYEGEAGTVHTFYYTRNTYSVQFDYNGGHQDPGGKHGDNGATEATETMTYGSDKNTTVGWLYPHREGYEFIGWYDEADGGNAAFDANHAHVNGTYWKNDLWWYAENDLTLYAQWDPYTYTVQYAGNGATSGKMGNQEFTYDVPVNLTENSFERQYTVQFDTAGGSAQIDDMTAVAEFTGWSHGENTYQDEQSVSNLTATDEDTVILTAQWTLESIVLPDPGTRTGYTFAGWYVKPVSRASSEGTRVGDVGDSYTPQADIALYAEWEIIEYTANFDVNGGSVLADTELKFTVEEPLALPATTKTGYTLKWVVTEAEGNWDVNDEYDASETCQDLYGNVKFTAQWSVVTYNISYNLAGGTLAQENPDSYTVETPDFELNNPTKTGYYFNGWTGSNGDTPQTSVTIAQESTGDRTYTANFTPNPYTLEVYATYGNWNEKSIVDVVYDSTQNNDLNGKLPENNFYTLTGLYTAKDGGVQVYDGEGKYVSGTGYWDEAGKWIHEGNVELYGHWEPATYTITYVDDFADGTTQVEYSPNGEKIHYFPTPECPQGYTFKGWRPSVDSGTWSVGWLYGEEHYCKSTEGQYGDVTLVAQWERVVANLTITTTCNDADQSFVFTITGTPDDTAYGTITLDVVLVGNDSITVRDLPVGTYSVTEKGDWSWRQDENAAAEDFRVDSDTEKFFAFGAAENTYWLSGLFYKLTKGGSQ